MTSLYLSGKTPQAVALAFAVASLQNQSGLGGFPTIPPGFIEAAAAGSPAVLSSRIPNVSFDSGDDRVTKKQLHPPTSSSSNRMVMSTSSKKPKLAEYCDDDYGDEAQEECGGGGDDNEDDNERRLARSRERNREHARKTRLRKKAQLESLQSKVKGLEAERQVLKQKVEECGIASILLGLSAGEQQQDNTNSRRDVSDSGASTASTVVGVSSSSSSSHAGSNSTSTLPDGASTSEETVPGAAATVDEEDSQQSSQQRSTTAMTDSMVAALSGAKRKRFISEAIGEQPNQHRLTINVDGHVTIIGAGKSHINWKTGVYRDQQGVQRQLTSEQLEDLRRERNRMHAKMTRSRKKCFISTIEKAIEELEAENRRMRDILEKVASSPFFSNSPVTTSSSRTEMVSSKQREKQLPIHISPATSPGHAPSPGPSLQESFNSEEDEEDSSVYSEPVQKQEKHLLPKTTTQRVAAGAAIHGFQLDS